jgi:hypothetical protein
LIWCFLALCASWWIPTPEASLFPEIDFASKLVPTDKFTVLDLDEKPKVFSSVVENSISDFSRLSNAGTMEIKRRLAPARFFVQFSKGDESAIEREVVLKVEEDGWPLSNDSRRV